MNERAFIENLTIIVDSREQKPYLFDGYKTVTHCLPVGDYSLSNLENEISIERKSLNDMIGSLSSGRERFEKEIQRGSQLLYFSLIIESSLNDLLSGKYRSRMLPASAVQTLLSWSVKYRLPVFFAESRQHGEKITLSLLQKYARAIFQKYHSLAKT